jgi:threonine synthase
MATLAYEVVEQLGKGPGTVITPVGQGTLLLGAHAGFKALQARGEIDQLPRLVAVQARACAPIWAVTTSGAAGLALVREQETVAEGVRIAQPLRGDLILAALEETDGLALAVEEAEILRGRVQLSQEGFYVEPTSAVVWPALEAALSDLPGPIVVILTGSGLKDPRQIPT